MPIFELKEAFNFDFQIHFVSIVTQQLQHANSVAFLSARFNQIQFKLHIAFLNCIGLPGSGKSTLLKALKILHDCQNIHELQYQVITYLGVIC